MLAELEKRLKESASESDVKAIMRELQKLPKSAKVHELRGLALLRLDDHAAALHEFEAAFALDATMHKAAFLAGMCFRMMRKVDKAVAKLELAASLAPHIIRYKAFVASFLTDLIVSAGPPVDNKIPFQLGGNWQRKDVPEAI